jgi:hypothetical protein
LKGFCDARNDKKTNNIANINIAAEYRQGWPIRNIPD